MWLCINISSNYVLALYINNYHKLSGLPLTPSLLCFSSGGHTSETGPTGLKSRCQLGPVTSEGSKGEALSLCFQLLQSLPHTPSPSLESTERHLEISDSLCGLTMSLTKMFTLGWSESSSKISLSHGQLIDNLHSSLPWNIFPVSRN